MALCLCSCAHEKEEKATTIHNVYVVTPSGQMSGDERQFAGMVEEKSELSVGFKTAGQLNRIYVREGQHVSKGQLLASLDNSDYKLGVEALQIQYDQVKEEVGRAQKLFEKKSMSANDYEKAVAGLQQLGVQLQANKNKLAYTRLTSPSSGIIESVNFSAGEMVDAGTAVFTLIDVSQKTVVVDIPVSLYLNREEIKEIYCSTTHSPATEYAMNVMSIVPKADGNQLYRMKLGFKGGSNALTPGMNVTVRFEFKSQVNENLKIPGSALFRKDGKDFVWIMRPDSTISMRQVVINTHYDGPEVEVISGLSPADYVIRAGVRMLHEGEKVKVIEKPSETNFGGVL
ncbi:MAG: efflux RND transporter periplasmic adaptor subunit [Muribaculaceae bacterium]|nr:efflux RND transporter periplasmic adaptor subunit [Muribaculaceae bacterium]